MRHHHQLGAVYYYAIALCCAVTLRITLCCGAAGSDEIGRVKRDGIDEHSAAEQLLIPLTKCCDIGEFYNAGFDSCLEWENYLTSQQVQLHYTTSFLHVPPFYNSDNEDGRVHPVAPSAFLLSFNTNLTFCPNGQIVKTTTDFHLYKNGSMKTINDETNKRIKPAGEFCVDRILTQQQTTENSTAVFVSRYCIDDPCANKTMGCVHKCCPIGMALNETERICQPSSLPFEIPFHHDDAQLLASQMVVSDGMFVDCQHGAYPLRPSLEPDDEFYILADGRLHAPALGDEYNDDYCIDHFVSQDLVAMQALVCFPPQLEETHENIVIRSIYPYFLFVSSLFLIATFFIHAWLPELRNTHGVTVMCHVASMTVMYVGLGTIQLSHHLSDGVCVGLAVTVHFAFLATFTWLNVLSFDIWWTFNDRRLPARRHRKLGRRFAYYSLYAWSVPTIIVVFGQIVDNVKGLSEHIYQPQFGIYKCWFHTPGSFYTFLYGPMAVLILANIWFFIMTAVTLCRVGTTIHNKDDASSIFYSKQKFRAIFVLFILMGVCWITEVISFAVGGSAYLWIPTDILNILTAVFVFIIFVCKPNVWSLLMKRHPNLQRFDRSCPTCMKYDNNGHQENEDRSFLDLQQTTI